MSLRFPAKAAVPGKPRACARVSACPACGRASRALTHLDKEGHWYGDGNGTGEIWIVGHDDVAA